MLGQGFVQFSKVNPVAKALLQSRRRTQVKQHKKGKGSYDRNKVKENDRKEKDTGLDTKA